MNYKFYLVFQQKRLTLGERQAMCEQLVKEEKKNKKQKHDKITYVAKTH